MPTKSWTIGSDPQCDLVVENVTVSGHHCRLEQVGDSFRLTDLNSSNGTFVNGQRVDDSASVSRKDRITLGQTQAMPWPPLATDASPQVITIGRSPKNVLVIDESNVSSVHAQLTISKRGMVLEDLGSTNGTSIGTVENKINRSAVKLSDTIFLGSIPYVVSELIMRASSDAAKPVAGQSVSNEAKPVDVKVPEEKQAIRPRSSLPAKIGLAVLAAMLLALILWVVLPGSDSGVKNDDLAASTNQTSNETNSDSTNSEPNLTDSPPVAIPEQDSRDATEDEQKPLTDSEKLARSLFLLVCSDQNGEMHFRVGTAFAIDSNHVATSASAISVMQDLQKNGFPKAYLYNPDSKKKIEIVSTKVHPQYDIANTEARRAQQEHDGILDDLDVQSPSEEAFESVKESLMESRLKAIESFDLKTTCDVGIIEVEQTLEHWLEGVDPAASLRPKLKLNVTGFAHDREDPYFDISSSIKFSTMTSRIKQVSRWSNDSLQRLEVTEQVIDAESKPTQMEYSYLGCPAINDQGQVVAIYSRPFPAENASGEPSEGEAESVAEFDAPLFIRVRECLENRP